jgi:predicted N-acyltransferase
MTNSIRFIDSIHQVGLKKWNQLLNSDNPFLRFEFLAALEDSQCIDSPRYEQSQTDPLNSGWIPHYAILESSVMPSTMPEANTETKVAIERSSENYERTILAIAPVYKKLHSFGEYVFDWSWADAYEKHGLHYYPKLVWAIPFTPSTGPRIINQGSAELTQAYYQQIAHALTQYCQAQDYSSWHCLFPNTQANEALSSPSQPPISNKIMWRQSCQFHWFNNSEASHKFNADKLNNKEIDTDNSFRDFAHYLEKFSSRKRKNIKKERSKLRQAGFIFKQINAHDISDADIKAFYHCYQLTYVKRNRRGYLTLEFFQQIIKTMPEQILLVQALYQEKPGCEKTAAENSSAENSSSEKPNAGNPSSLKIVASALYFKDENNLYGRYWGCLEEYDSLHFECCYYQGIEYCIANNIHHFDPGTQGEHKISRGFEPTICASQHWIAHPQFSDAIDDFIKDENDYMKNYAKQVIEHLPFKYINSSTPTSMLD